MPRATGGTSLFEIIFPLMRKDQVDLPPAIPGIDVNAGNPLYFAVALDNFAAINILAENPGLDWNVGLTDRLIETALLRQCNRFDI